MVDGSRDIAGTLHRLELSIARSGFEAAPVRAALVEIDAQLRELDEWAEHTSAQLADAEDKCGDHLVTDTEVTLWFVFNDRPAAKSHLEGQSVSSELEAGVDTDEVVEAARSQGDGLIGEAPVSKVMPPETRPVVGEHRIGFESDLVGQVIDEGRDELVFVIDDRDQRHPNSRGKRWPNLGRAGRKARRMARHNDATSERFRRVLSSSNGVKDADPDEVEARIRNLSHGTNSE